MSDFKPQDDKRFLRNEQKKVPIQLPEIEHPPQEETPPEKDLKREPEKEKIPPAAPTLPAEKGPKTSQGHQILFMYILAVFFGTSFIANIFFYYNLSESKKKVSSDVKLAEQMIIEKQKVSAEKESLKGEVDRLKRELQIAANTSESLRKELAKNKEKNLELENSIEGYTGKLKELSEKRTGYYDAYQKEKENVKALNLTIKTLKDNLDALRAKMDSIDNKFEEKEAKYIYNIAFLYLKANMFDEALENFKKLLQSNEGNADIHYNIGYIYEHIKRDKNEALKHYKKYLMLKPDAEDLYEVKLKVAFLERTGGEPTGNFAVDKSEFFIEKADELYEKEKYKEAYELYEKALEDFKY